MLTTRRSLLDVRAADRVDAAAFVLAGGAVVLLAIDQGGFFPRTWPWAGIAFAAVAGLLALTIESPQLGAGRIALVAGLAGLTAWIALSVDWSSEPPTSRVEATRAPLYVAAAAALTLAAGGGGAVALLYGLVAGATGLAAYGLAERVAHGPDAGAQPGLLAEPLGYANALGALLAIAVVVAVGLANRRRPWPLAAVPVLGVALALTESRASWIAAAGGLAVVAAARARGRRAAAATAAVLGAALAALLVATAFRAPAALEARGSYWHIAWRVASEHPLRGDGAGTFDLAWARFGDIARWEGALDAHSLYLETLSELGAVGLLLVLAALVLPLGTALATEGAAPAALGGGVVFVLHAGVDWDWEMPAVTVAGLVCLAAAATGGAALPPRLVRLGAGVLALAVGAAYGILLLVS